MGITITSRRNNDASCSVAAGGGRRGGSGIDGPLGALGYVTQFFYYKHPHFWVEPGKEIENSN